MNVQTLSRSSKTMSIDEFFDWIDTREERYELIEGTPRLQPWVKRNHNRIVMNVVACLHRSLDREAYEIATGDFAIPTGPHSIRYADVMVEKAGGSGQARTTESPVLIVEVLSPSTASEDFGRKQREYLNLPTLADCLIVAQDNRCIWQWSRDENGGWPENPMVLEDGAIELTTLGTRLTMDEIYRNVS